jgi:signal transduction histidine kinase
MLKALLNVPTNGRPSHEVTQARLLQQTALILFIVIGIINAITTYSDIRRGNALVELMVLTPVMGLMLGVMWLNQRGHYTAAARLGIGVGWLAMVAYASDTYFALIYLVLVVLISGLFLKQRETLLIAVASIALSLFGHVFLTPEPIGISLTVLNYMLVVMPIAVLFIQQRHRMDSERRQALEARNAQLQASEAMLEQRVEERTRELEEALEQLKEVDNIKSRFLASMSHELRTPLNAILNFTKFVSTGMLGEINDAQRDALDKTIESGKHLLSLINDVLDITKIESNMLALFVEKGVGVAEELLTVLSMTEVLLEDKPNVKVTYDIPKDLPTLYGDRRRIRQIVINLVSNACKFTEEGEIAIIARADATSMMVMVKDSGVGIPKADQETIFQPFRQSREGLKHGDGTGLGLPIARRLAEAHEGSLSVTSEEGQGTTFTLTLPLASPKMVALYEESQQEMLARQTQTA